MIINIAVPATAAAVPTCTLDVETAELPGQSTEINLELPNRDFAEQLRIFLTFKGERRELIARVSPSAHQQVMRRMISAALNAPPDFAASVDAFELRLLGLLVVSDDCLMSPEALTKMLENFYADFEEADVNAAIDTLRGKLAAFRVPVKILGETESGFRLQS